MLMLQGGREWEELLGGDASPGKRWRLIYTVGMSQLSTRTAKCTVCSSVRGLCYAIAIPKHSSSCNLRHEHC